MERFVGLLGLALLVGLAFLFSNNKRKINLRTVLWGMGLQLLFAVIILSRNQLSFFGMFLFAFLIILYLVHESLHALWKSGWLACLIIFFGSALLTLACYGLDKAGLALYLLAAAGLFYLIGLLLQRRVLARFASLALILLAVGILWSRTIYGADVLQFVSGKVKGFLDLSLMGSKFLFGKLGIPDGEVIKNLGYQFAFIILPTIIFFSAFMSILYQLGIIQRVITAMARFMHWTMGTSGSETLSCSANVFVGQTEAPFLVKPFLKGMTNSELHAVMVGGFATIAGGVMAAYMQMGVDPGHLIAASVMSAPAALVIAKMLLPETEHSETAGDVAIPKVRTARNILEAATNGVTDGLKLALNVGAMLIAFVALIGLIDILLAWLDGLVDNTLLGMTRRGEPVAMILSWARGQLPGQGALAANLTTEFAGFFPGSLQTLFGWVFSPLAWAMGVPWKDAAAVGDLLGLKIAANELVAYSKLAGQIGTAQLSPKAILIATYALCGFANFASIGIQLGGISAIAPERKSDLAKLGLRAMFGGALASWMTASIAGVLAG